MVLDWYTIVSVVAIPFIVQLIKKFIPVQWAPIVAITVALILVVIGKLFGIGIDFNNTLQALLAALATAGVAIIGYDQVKQITK